MNGRKAIGEGRGLGGRQTQSRAVKVGSQMQDRFEDREKRIRGEAVTQKVMEAGHDPNFRERPEIAEMRDRAANFKKNYRPSSESFEQAAKRLKQRRG